MVKSKLSIKEEIDLYKKFNQTNILRIVRQITRYMNNEISNRLLEKGHTGLSARHLSVFENLDFEGTNIVTLAGRAGMTKQAMSKLVKEVAAEKYIYVKTDQRDSRVLIVLFTERGIEFLRDMREEIIRTRENMLSEGILSNKESNEMTVTLGKLLSYFQISSN